MSSSIDSGPQGLSRRPPRSAVGPTEVFDNEIVPPSLRSIAPILRLATEIEPESPRFAYLCRFYVLEKACRLDPNSSGHAVSQFKSDLLHRLERENSSSLASRVKKSDAREIRSFYQNRIRGLGEWEYYSDSNRAQLGKAYQTAGVLFEVLCSVEKRLQKVAPEVSERR